MVGAREQDHGRGPGKLSARIAASLAWLLCALCVALAVLAVGLDSYTPPTRHEPDFAVLAGIPLLVYPIIGALVVSHRPKKTGIGLSPAGYWRVSFPMAAISPPG